MNFAALDAPRLRPLSRAMLGVKQGKAMTNTIGKFDYKIDIHGARVVVAKEPLCSGCLSDSEIDTNIQLLKDDLDAVATRMKAAVRKQAQKPDF